MFNALTVEGLRSVAWWRASLLDLGRSESGRSGGGRVGWAFLGERVGALRAGLVILIALGAVVVEFG